MEIKKTDSVKLVDTQIKRNEELKEAFDVLFNKINTLCVSSRETSLAITKLEEAQMWATKSISREDTIYEVE